MKAKVIRGVRIRDHKAGVTNAYGPGDIVDVTPQEFSELKHTNYVVAAPADEPAAATAPEPPVATSTRYEKASEKK